MSILAKKDFTDEGFDTGKISQMRVLPQKNEEDFPELVGILSPGAWQSGVGALDLTGVDSRTHTQDYLCVWSLRRETYSSVAPKPSP